MSTKRVNIEPLRYQRLPQDTKQEQQCDDRNSSEFFNIFIPPSRSAVPELVANIMSSTPIPGITEEYFLTETDVHDLVSAYIPDDIVASDDLSTWMSKDGSWDFTWDDLSDIQEYRSLVKSSMDTKCTVGFVLKSNTNEPDTTKKKLVNLQIYKMKSKLLCEAVFVSFNTSANDLIADRDVTTLPYTFDDYSGNTQDLITKITKSARQIRLVVIDHSGLTTNPDNIRLFISLNKSIQELVEDIGHKVEVYSRYDLLKNIKILNKF
ncbi:hypothetical protein PHYBLDRAFT_164063 [Phycomyces blakesleeanus NRRL 1555(-)]|uniref:Uncharacterized protein n=3 Tax=Phycomyces blakesleeanus TaxID=4837 RepID=A0A167Q2X9_PHYB8|nr:hypothetical protein PHYBLDRAFT_164063 [Phycomyces blakesleeanus NRRL 1555(-)]OAD78969.1 hypothetical protein PHYBLDRAFT_164063 [Phycomyces blakesleeanus NRRL 1555(-)]|eukprot:XP_018297009.1 hypothetical protein PHYBLDRAFT_164063 [Phycomyces blakesleeanus NRRL 1555(-)]